MLNVECFDLENHEGVRVLRLRSGDGTNRLTSECVRALVEAFRDLALTPKPLIVTGNRRFFSAGADLREIASLTGPQAHGFSAMGQNLMNMVEQFPARVYAAISGYCMGGGLDLALACHQRIASRDAILGHRGSALGLITGWGGTQRLPRLVGRAKALEMFVAAEKLDADNSLSCGLIDAIAEHPIAESARRINSSCVSL